MNIRQTLIDIEAELLRDDYDYRMYVAINLVNQQITEELNQEWMDLFWYLDADDVLIWQGPEDS